jgi:hypothetical protein
MVEVMMTLFEEGLSSGFVTRLEGRRFPAGLSRAPMLTIRRRVFAEIPRNPLKSPEPDEGIQENPSLLPWIPFHFPWIFLGKAWTGLVSLGLASLEARSSPFAEARSLYPNDYIAAGQVFAVQNKQP